MGFSVLIFKLSLLLFLIMKSDCISGFQLIDRIGGRAEPGEAGLLLYYNYSKPGTVCDDSFSDNSAIAICRMLGCDYADGWNSGAVWSIQDNLPIKMDDVVCTAPFWPSCTYRTSHNCDHSEDIFLTCSYYTNITCPPGKYFQRTVSSDTCMDCPSNTYKSYSGNWESCTTCPSSAKSAPGASYCSCRAGQFWSGTQCQVCQQGQASHEGSLQCVSCPNGSVALNNGSACSCPRGMVWDWNNNGGSCTPCPPGTYKGVDGNSCKACPLDSTSMWGFDHCICEAGSFWNETQCDNCTEGTASPGGALQCLACPYGSNNTADRTICYCPAETHWSWDHLGNGSCSFNTNAAFIVTWGVLLLIIILIYRKKKNLARFSSAMNIAGGVEKKGYIEKEFANLDKRFPFEGQYYK